MKLNIFSVPQLNIASLKEKFESVGLSAIHRGSQPPWQATFFFSEGEEPNPIPWARTFAELFGDRDFSNLIYFGAYVFERDDACLVLTFGKTHFYVRPFCDHDFGIEVAKRLADEGDIKQKASKKFAGRRKKEIRSYTSNTQLSIESGESVDYLQAAVAQQERETFGKTAKFGASVLLNAPIEKTEIGELLAKLMEVCRRPPAFPLPRTIVVTDITEAARYDNLLIDAITGDDQGTEFTQSGHDLVGVDFIFSGNEQYTLRCRGYEPLDLADEDLDLEALRSYISDRGIGRDAVLDIRVKVDNEGQKSFSKTLREALDFIVDGENVMLSQGRWLRFNEDYIDQLNTSIDGITVEDVEADFEVITMVEGDFNNWKTVKDHGYALADKDFSKIATRLTTPIEAWDLRKDTVVYAVKFGSSQKIHYVCDQATAVLEVIRNNANVKQLDEGWHVYCLWLGFKLAAVPEKISDVNSIILKQKIDAWAGRCRELGIEPRLKISRRQ